MANILTKDATPTAPAVDRPLSLSFGETGAVDRPFWLGYGVADRIFLLLAAWRATFGISPLSIDVLRASELHARRIESAMRSVWSLMRATNGMLKLECGTLFAALD